MPAARLLIITFSIALIRVTRITLPVSEAVNSFDGFSQYYRESAQYTEKALCLPKKRSVCELLCSRSDEVDFPRGLPPNSFHRGRDAVTPTLDQTDFRNALARFASGVTVVITRNGEGRFVGFTASAFSSLSLDPPLILVCLQNDADCYQAFMEAESFTVSILATGQSDVALRFATKSIDKLEGTPVAMALSTGLPLIEGASAWLECRIHSRPDGGDHTILIGEVLGAGAGDVPPLLHYNRTFGRFTPA